MYRLPEFERHIANCGYCLKRYSRNSK
jgi:hypothetical protein